MLPNDVGHDYWESTLKYQASVGALSLWGLKEREPAMFVHKMAWTWPGIETRPCDFDKVSATPQTKGTDRDPTSKIYLNVASHVDMRLIHLTLDF